MIELIFAIVLIALVVVAVPQMIGQNTKGTEEYLKQEVIAAATGEAFRVMSYPWDASSVADSNRSYIVDVASSGNLARVGSGLPIRAGNIPPLKGTGANASNVDRYYHRRFFNSTTSPASKDLPGVGAIDSNLLTTRSSEGYKETYTVTATANGYLNDANGSGTFIFSDANSSSPSNMKLGTLQVNSSSQNNILTLRVYAANIGSAEYYTREF